jgi:hypothetical protein
MSKYLVAALAFAIVTLPVGGASQSPNPIINATGTWNVNPTGLAFASGILKLRQDGSTVVGSYGQGARSTASLNRAPCRSTLPGAIREAKVG